jgi:hypothetical protein
MQGSHRTARALRDGRPHRTTAALRCPLGGRCLQGPCVHELGYDLPLLNARCGDAVVCEERELSIFRPLAADSLEGLPVVCLSDEQWLGAGGEGGCSYCGSSHDGGYVAAFEFTSDVSQLACCAGDSVVCEGDGLFLFHRVPEADLASMPIVPRRAQESGLRLMV